MELKMKFSKETNFFKSGSQEFIIIELHGMPTLVEALKNKIIEYMKTQKDFDKHY